MYALLCLAIIVATCGSGLAQTTAPPHNPCRTCEILIGIAKRHFHNNFTDQGALKTQLDMECRNLANHGFTDAEVQGCIALVDNNMPAIYNELVTNPTASPRKICQDLMQCPTAVKRVKRQNSGECRTCEIIITLARHHFHNNINDQSALQNQLLDECDGLSFLQGQAAADHCKQVINANIAQIFADMSTNKSPRQTCVDIKECTNFKAVKRVKRQNSGECKTCEIIISLARYHFGNNINDQGALLDQLLDECDGLSFLSGQEVADHCKQVINANIAQIFADMSTNKSPRQTCVDIKECSNGKVLTRFNRKS